MRPPDFSDLEKIFPSYLCNASKASLLDCLKEKSTNYDYFAGSWVGPEQPIQGDVWSTFLKYDFAASGIREVSGIVCSNTCDIDSENASLRQRNILFAPVTTLDAYRSLLMKEGIAEERLSTHVRAIKRQEKTDIFYIPEAAKTPELLVLLDDISSQPLSLFLRDDNDRRQLVRFNNFGFYMFLMKLSIHFARFGEALDRSAETP